MRGICVIGGGFDTGPTRRSGKLHKEAGKWGGEDEAEEEVSYGNKNNYNYNYNYKQWRRSGQFTEHRRSRSGVRPRGGSDNWTKLSVHVHSNYPNAAWRRWTSSPCHFLCGRRYCFPHYTFRGMYNYTKVVLG